MGDKMKKKLTKKELKALNHAKLMDSRKNKGIAQPQTDSNVIQFQKPDDKKKAA